ncbi:SRPBCC domain-containing protein [Streptosporangium saharense]|uniref:SRPBCC domain-containing protein n=1 Tax=Streptosporangium saharense TaxID=1706840 RepID=UPI00368A5A59
MGGTLNKTMLIKAPVERVWRSFTDPAELAVWYVPGVKVFEARPGGRVEFDIPHTIGTVVGEVLAAERPYLLSWREGPGLLPGPTEIAIRLTEADGGTRLNYEQTGFGGGPEWADEIQAHDIGWGQCLADLALVSETGVRARRTSRARSQFGVVSLDTAAGLRVLGVKPGSCADRAGLRPDDLLVRLNGGAVFSRRELWFFSSEHVPGDPVTADWIRDGVTMSGASTLDGPPARAEMTNDAPIDYGGNATLSQSAR